MTKQYIGTKTITAIAMTRLAYNEYRGWQLPADENGADDGYLVEYQDGGAPNHPDHAGYISWSPKAQFDAAYRCMGDVSHLEPHQQRVVGEQVQLNEKLDKLCGFLDGKAKEVLDPAEFDRMSRQADAMSDYSKILAERIEAFGGPLHPSERTRGGGDEVYERAEVEMLTKAERVGMFDYDPLEDQQA